MISSLGSGALEGQTYRLDFASSNVGRVPFDFPTPTEVLARAAGSPEDPISGLQFVKYEGSTHLLQ